MKVLAALLCLSFVSLHPRLSYGDDLSGSDLRLASLDTVWQTVNEYHFDSTFGGVDWKEIHSRYQDQVAQTEDDDFIGLANQMLQELKLSHYAVFNMKDKANSGSPLMSPGSVGIDVRLRDRTVFISKLMPGFPADRAGLKAGYIVETINGIAVEQIITEAEADQVAHFDERQKESEIGDLLAGYFFGPPDTSLVLTCRDDTGALREDTLTMMQRSGRVVLSDLIPPLYIDFEARRLAGNIGYVSFNAFAPPVDERFAAAIDTMMDMRGLILDIRGNPGGMHEIGEAIATKLINKETLFSIFKYRDETREVVLQPSERVYDGPVVVLIDMMNASASERFSGCLQSIGRAVVIGERSSGSVGPSDLKQLPNGASFLYLVAQSLTPDGIVLEGHGVVPDVATRLDRAFLLKGTDTQLAGAIEYIKNETD